MAFIAGISARPFSRERKPQLSLASDGQGKSQPFHPPLEAPENQAHI